MKLEPKSNQIQKKLGKIGVVERKKRGWRKEGAVSVCAGGEIGIGAIEESYMCVPEVESALGSDRGGDRSFDRRVGVFQALDGCVLVMDTQSSGKKGCYSGDNIKRDGEGESDNEVVVDRKKVLPPIKAKWPLNHTGPIFIQQDNAKPHIEVNDSEFLEASSQDGFDIRLCFQPPNSPDLNVLDLGFLRAIQSLQEQEVLHTVDELVSAVQTSFDKMQSHELNNVFLTLQTCMKEILKVQGGNNYRIPHIGKNWLERQGNLPLQIECEQSLIDEAVSYLVH
ncbi:hypothetical protein LXL04_019853 [Taraxacum kok-saghyz]